MDDCIAKQAALDLIESAGAWGWSKNRLFDEMNDLPAADVAPVVHGRWEHLGGDEWNCSSCGFVICTDGSWEKPPAKYCQDCGAKMDLEG